MNRKKLFLLIPFSLLFQWVAAQTIDLQEKVTKISNGIEYGYTIRNEQVKAAKGEEYSRYEITVFMTNKSGCQHIYPLRLSSTYNSTSQNLLATFHCYNANGKRFTSKSALIYARDFYTPVKRKDQEKDKIESIQIGYIFRNGETLQDNIIVLVPKGERPVISVTANNLPELQ
jgi:hypothetical protein